MNIFQKITGLITLICIAITLAVLFVCFSMPFSWILLTEIYAIIFATIVLGSIGICLYGRSDKELAYSHTLWIPGSLYFLFVLFMIYPASGNMQTRHFVLIHGIGCAVFLIGMLIFRLGRHSIQETGATADSGMKQKDAMVHEMQIAFTLFSNSHPQERELIKSSEQLLDSLRFAPVLISSDAGYDSQILERLKELKECASTPSAELYRTNLQEISKLFLLRERIEKV